jgi:Ca2+-binding RTX toxin-like protein
MAIRIGTRGNDTLNGTSGDDFFFGDAGNDVMNGGAGNDTFVSSAGADTFNGGTGIDTVDYSQITQATDPFLGLIDGVMVNLTAGVGGDYQSAYEGDGWDSYSSIENVTGSNFNDMIVGDKSANVIKGLDGVDFLEGMGGADTLDGGDGYDFLTYYYSAVGVTADLQSGTGSGGDASGDTFTNFEGLIGSSYDDKLYGDGGDNDITGGAGNDKINGRGGADYIEGAAGNDTLTGGSGSDTFKYFSHTLTSHSGTDHITDFNVDQDKIVFETNGGGETVGISIFNFNTATFTVSVDVVLGQSGHVILDNISLADLGDVMGAIELV